MADPLNMPPDNELRWYGTPTPAQPTKAMVGLLHPGQMGAAVGASAVTAGAHVMWCSDERSVASKARAEAAGFQDVGWLNALVNRSELILSVCPPGAAEALAEEVTSLGFNGIYLDANAIAPATVRRIAARVEETGAHVVDGGIIGSPPERPGDARLYLSGAFASTAARMLAGGPLEVVVIEGPVGAASALKQAYGGWTKGTAALLAAIEALALAEGVHGVLTAEWARSQPALAARSAGLDDAARKAWRWIAEMEEGAATFAGAGLPPGFAEAAAEVYRRLERFKDDPDAPAGAYLAHYLLPE